MEARKIAFRKRSAMSMIPTETFSEIRPSS